MLVHRELLASWLPDVIASLKEDCPAVEINTMVRASISLCPGMSHQVFRVPSGEGKI